MCLQQADARTKACVVGESGAPGEELLAGRGRDQIHDRHIVKCQLL
jgi:hypothetical protein